MVYSDGCQALKTTESDLTESHRYLNRTSSGCKARNPRFRSEFCFVFFALRKDTRVLRVRQNIRRSFGGVTWELIKIFPRSESKDPSDHRAPVEQEEVSCPVACILSIPFHSSLYNPSWQSLPNAPKSQ